MDNDSLSRPSELYFVLKILRYSNSNSRENNGCQEYENICVRDRKLGYSTSIRFILICAFQVHLGWVTGAVGLTTAEVLASIVVTMTTTCAVQQSGEWPSQSVATSK